MIASISRTEIESQLPNLQAQADCRGIPIQHVGVSNVSLPFIVTSVEGNHIPTIGKLDITTNLSAKLKGTHMSRMIETIMPATGFAMNTSEALKDWLFNAAHKLLDSLEAQSARLKLSFSYVIRQVTPVSDRFTFSKVPIELIAEVKRYPELQEKEEFLTTAITHTGTSLCPCSKDISKYGAHNQRSIVRLAVQTPNVYIPFELLIRIVSDQFSCPIYNLLKRPDEKAVTERAYENPKFVEDILRDIILAITNNDTWREIQVNDDFLLLGYSVHVTNEESIHQHDAVAWINWPKANDFLM